MGDQGCCKHSIEVESKMVHDNVRRGVQVQKEIGLLILLILL